MLARKFSVKVVGVTFHDGYPDNLHALQALSVRAPLEASLIREPDNEYDPNAVAVLAGGEIIGHLPRGLAAKVAPQLDAGVQFRVTQASLLINPEHTDRPGFLIECEEVSREWAKF